MINLPCTIAFTSDHNLCIMNAENILRITANVVKFLRVLRIRLGPLASDRQPHRVSLSNPATNHPVMLYVFSDLSPQLRLNLQAIERIPRLLSHLPILLRPVLLFGRLLLSPGFEFGLQSL